MNDICDLIELENLADQSICSVRGTILWVKFNTIRGGQYKGKDVAYILLKDPTGTIVVMAYPKDLEPDNFGNNALMQWLKPGNETIFKGKFNRDPKAKHRIDFISFEPIIKAMVCSCDSLSLFKFGCNCGFIKS